VAIEGGSTFSEGAGATSEGLQPAVREHGQAGELGGVLEVVLNRLSEFMEKAQKIKGKVIAAMFYPIAVLVVATCILGILMVYVIPKFKDVFAGMLDNARCRPSPASLLAISDTVKGHFVYIPSAAWPVFVVLS